MTSPPDDHDLVLRLAASAYLGRYTGTSRTHTESDLRLFFAWCADQHLAPLTAQRMQLERYVRWMQEIRRFKPSTVSRRALAIVWPPTRPAPILSNWLAAWANGGRSGRRKRATAPSG